MSNAPIVVETIETIVTVEPSTTDSIDVEVLQNVLSVETDIPQISLVEVSTPGPQGAKGAQGDPGTSATSQYIHTQLTPSTRWAIQHNLSRMPTTILMWDNSHFEIEGDVEDPTTSDDPLNILYVRHWIPQVGTAHVS